MSGIRKIYKNSNSNKILTSRGVVAKHTNRVSGRYKQYLAAYGCFQTYNRCQAWRRWFCCILIDDADARSLEVSLNIEQQQTSVVRDKTDPVPITRHLIEHRVIQTNISTVYGMVSHWIQIFQSAFSMSMKRCYSITPVSGFWCTAIVVNCACRWARDIAMNT